MRKSLLFTTIATLILLGIAPKSWAISTDKTVRISWKILPFQVLIINGKGNPGKRVITTYNIPQPTHQDLKRGYIQEESALSLTVVSNVDWVIKVRALSEDLGTSWKGKYLKPLSHFLFRSPQTEFMVIQQEPQKIAWGEKGRKVVDIDYRVEGYSNDYQPGSYKITLEYTITTP
jgi:hypothetical protein